MQLRPHRHWNMLKPHARTRALACTAGVAWHKRVKTKIECRVSVISAFFHEDFMVALDVKGMGPVQASGSKAAAMVAESVH